MPSDRAQDTEAIRAALANWRVGNTHRQMDTALEALDRLVARLEAAERKAADGILFENAARACPGEITLAKFLGLVDEMRAAGREVGAALAAAAPGETTPNAVVWSEPRQDYTGRVHRDGLATGTGAAPGETEQTP